MQVLEGLVGKVTLFATTAHFPVGSFQEETVDEGTVLGSLQLVGVSLVLDDRLQDDAVKGKLLLPSSDLHDSRQEGHWVEQARDPQAGWGLYHVGPVLELGVTTDHVCEPIVETLLREVGNLCPAVWNESERKRSGQLVHGVSDVESTLQSHVKLGQRDSNRAGEQVHALALLESNDPHWAWLLVVRFLQLELDQAELIRDILDKVVDDLLDTATITRGLSSALDLENLVEERLSSSSEVTDFSVWMETEHLRSLSWERGLNEFEIPVAIEPVRVWTSETLGKGQLHVVHDLLADDDGEVCVVRAAIHVIGNVTTVHDFSVDVTQIQVRHFLVLAEVVVQHISADGQVTIVEVVDLRPADGAELSATEDEGVEHAQTEDESLELRFLVRLCAVEVLLWELAEGTTKVGLQVRRSLVRNLDGVLQD